MKNFIFILTRYQFEFVVQNFMLSTIKLSPDDWKSQHHFSVDRFMDIEW